MCKIRIRTKRPWIAYSGSTLQQNYGEDVKHGYLLWDINGPKSFDVRFHELPNPSPFVTIEWTGDVNATMDVLKKSYPLGSRVRIYSKTELPQKDAVLLTSRLRQEMKVSEVTFKTDHTVNVNIVNTGAMSFAKEDLRSPDVLLRMLKDFHKSSTVSEDEWTAVSECLTSYLVYSNDPDGVVRNTKWSLRHLKFDNTFAYGDGNVINFDNLSGTCGIFGNNRIGKSSIVGTIMYSLFNSTDRGPIKSLWVPNLRKEHCYTRAILNVNGTDYVIERQTTKHQNKYGTKNANTALNVFRMEGDEAVDIAGEQRSDTEKIVKKLIGTPEDFLMTSLSAQDDAKLFITQGSTRRKQIVSKFLDLDIFDKMYDLAKDDLKSCQFQLKTLPDRDWLSLAASGDARIIECAASLEEKDHLLLEAHDKSNTLKNELLSFKDVVPVTKVQVDGHRQRVTALTKSVSDTESSILSIKEEISTIDNKISSIDEATKNNDINDLKRRLEAFKALESSVISLTHMHEKEAAALKQQERSLKILDDVPCGDQFPTCKFIKDAHINKGKVEGQRDRVIKALEKLKKADSALATLKTENLVDRVSKVERLIDARSKLVVESYNKNLELMKASSSHEVIVNQLAGAKAKLDELETAYQNEENAEVVSLRNKLDREAVIIKSLDAERLQLASEISLLKSQAQRHNLEQEQRLQLLQKMRAYELVVSAFSRKGIPHVIVTSQLPLINAEIAKIMHGIFDFTIELVSDDDDSLEVYINYGDSARIIELSSGMEKVIASMAIRVALINVSTLPKTDMFIIDEGFGALDEMSVEICNRLLMLLKRYFKTVIIITHVEGIKDAADMFIEVTKVEKDAHVVYE